MLPTNVNWSNWGKFYTDLVLWEKPIREVLLRQGYEVRRAQTAFPGTSAAFLVNCELLSTPIPATLVVKFYPPMVVSDYETELEVRAALRDNGSSVPYPRVIASGVYSDAESETVWPYIIEEFCHGQPARDVWAGMNQVSRDGVGIQAARIVRDLHITPLKALPTLNVGLVKWREEARKRATVCVDELASTEIPLEPQVTASAAGKSRTAAASQSVHLSASLVSELRRFVDSHAERAIGSVDESSLRLLHNDLTEDHVLLERRATSEEWEITALLDYGDAKVGPAIEEWPILWVGLLDMDPTAFRAFLAAYRDLGEADPCDSGFREALFLFMLIHNFNWAILRKVVSKRKIDPSSLTSVDALISAFATF